MDSMARDMRHPCIPSTTVLGDTFSSWRLPAQSIAGFLLALFFLGLSLIDDAIRSNQCKNNRHGKLLHTLSLSLFIVL